VHIDEVTPWTPTLGDGAGLEADGLATKTVVEDEQATRTTASAIPVSSVLGPGRVP
jgi:hypothetical protein